MSIEPCSTLAEYFHDRLTAALSRLSVTAGPATEVYLVDLLSRSAGERGEALLSGTLAEALAAAYETRDPRERLRLLRTTGDTALYGCGFFGERYAHRGISQDYVQRMGGRAYQEASRVAVRGEVFRELAAGFSGFVRVLVEVREETALRTPQDIVRLYDRYRRTGAPTLAERLRQAGVFPQPGSGSLH